VRMSVTTVTRGTVRRSTPTERGVTMPPRR
jgi:hypothetical protein